MRLPSRMQHARIQLKLIDITSRKALKDFTRSSSPGDNFLTWIQPGVCGAHLEYGRIVLSKDGQGLNEYVLQLKTWIIDKGCKGC